LSGTASFLVIQIYFYNPLKIKTLLNEFGNLAHFRLAIWRNFAWQFGHKK
jgi:hypothetical protein